MRPSPAVEAQELVQHIDGLTLVGRMRGGEGSGAWEVRTAGGERAVLKFATGSGLDFAWAARVCTTLRARGYPAPRSLGTGVVAGVAFGLNELLPGTLMETPAPEHVQQLIALVDLQRGAGLPGRAPWVADVVTSITEGRDGYCEHDAMAAHSRRTRALLARVQRVALAAADVAVPLDDVVHMDLSPFNVLVDGPTVTGVFDWEGATTGDAAFDLVAHAMYTYDEALRDTLLDAARSRTDPRALTLYAAHMVLRQVDWSIRFHREPEVDWFTDVGTALLDAVGAG